MSICYAPLNRWVSVYRTNITWNYFQVDPFYFSFSLSFIFYWLFSLPCFFFGFLLLCDVCAGAEFCRQQHSFWQVSLMFNFYSHSSTLRVWRAPLSIRYMIRLFAPYGVCSTINSIFRLMVVIQTATKHNSNNQFDWTCVFLARLPTNISVSDA